MQSVQVFMRFKVRHQFKMSNTWHHYHRYGLIVLQLMAPKIVCSIELQANHSKVWQFGQTGGNLAEGHPKNWQVDALQRGEPVADDAQILKLEVIKTKAKYSETSSELLAQLKNGDQ